MLVYQRVICDWCFMFDNIHQTWRPQETPSRMVVAWEWSPGFLFRIKHGPVENDEVNWFNGQMVMMIQFEDDL